ncbi:MAG: family hydrolase [Candidatus Kaiserbacteria bacterium]|nr:family hydrolase [Candidatus Kaiserbacteria bacterium]
MCYSLAMERPKVAIFDFDDTLADSFQAPKPEMIERLARLMKLLPVAIMTGAGFERVQRDILAMLPAITSNLYIFPNSATQCYLYVDGTWKLEYNHALTLDERERIKAVLHEYLEQSTIMTDAPHFGERVIDREAQIAFTIVGVDAPQDVKKNWDVDGSKRRALLEMLRAKLGEFEILTGGLSTIDITHKDTNKAYGVRWLAEKLRIPPEEMFYVGDALYAGGNDQVVVPTGIKTKQVSGPSETAVVIDELLATLSA